MMTYDVMKETIIDRGLTLAHEDEAEQIAEVDDPVRGLEGLRLDHEGDFVVAVQPLYETKALSQSEREQLFTALLRANNAVVSGSFALQSVGEDKVVVYRGVFDLKREGDLDAVLDTVMLAAVEFSSLLESVEGRRV